MAISKRGKWGGGFPVILAQGVETLNFLGVKSPPYPLWGVVGLDIDKRIMVTDKYRVPTVTLMHAPRVITACCMYVFS